MTCRAPQRGQGLGVLHYLDLTGNMLRVVAKKQQESAEKRNDQLQDYVCIALQVQFYD